MFTNKTASERLNIGEELIDDILLNLNIENQIFDIKTLDETALVNYLERYISGITETSLRKIIEENNTLKGLILSLTCKSGSLLNLEPIWIILKIIKYNNMDKY